MQTLAQYGALEYGLAITQQLLQVAHLSYDSNSTPGARRAESMETFAEMIRVEIARQVERRLVVAAAIKDADSPLHALGTDMLRLVGQHLWHPEILRWEDVMRGCLELDSSPLVL